MSKVCEKLLISRLESVIADRKIIPNFQYGFRKKHSTIAQVHRVSKKKIRNALEEKKYCPAVFLDAEKAFDKVWHSGLIYKLSGLLLSNFVNIIDSYLNSRLFQVNLEGEKSEWRPIQAGVPQGSVFAPLLYLLYSSDIPAPAGSTSTMFADDVTILTVSNNYADAVTKLQRNINKVYRWSQRWRIKINETKSRAI